MYTQKVTIEFFFHICSWKMPLTPIKISVFYYKHDGHIPQNFYYSDDIDEIWGLGENEYPGLTKVLLSSNLFLNKIL